MSTNDVCDGAGASGGAAVAVSEYTQAGIGPVNANAQTLQQATITTPGAGRILAIVSVEAFCDASTCDGFFGAGTGAAWVWVTDDATDDVPGVGDSFSLVALQPGFSEAISRTEVFDVNAAGTFTDYVRGEGGASIFSTTQGASFFRRQLTLIYVP